MRLGQVLILAWISFRLVQFFEPANTERNLTFDTILSVQRNAWTHLESVITHSLASYEQFHDNIAAFHLLHDTFTAYFLKSEYFIRLISEDLPDTPYPQRCSGHMRLRHRAEHESNMISSTLTQLMSDLSTKVISRSLRADIQQRARIAACRSFSKSICTLMNRMLAPSMLWISSFFGIAPTKLDCAEIESKDQTLIPIGMLRNLTLVEESIGAVLWISKFALEYHQNFIKESGHLLRACEPPRDSCLQVDS